MILESLVNHYEDLLRQGKAPRLGWSSVKVSFALCLSSTGELEQVTSLRTEQIRGKKAVLTPLELPLPTPFKRTRGVAANFLCDNCIYMLGIDSKGKSERALECFNACKELHEKLLSGTDSHVAQAILRFFAQWDPAQAMEHPALAPVWDDILTGTNLVFLVNGEFAQDDSAIRATWQRYYDGISCTGPTMTCLVTGKTGPVVQLHPFIKGVSGAQATGATLVSFNAPAFCSHNHEQALNAPTSAYAAFAYGTALNHLIADREHLCHLGNTTLLCWADGGDEVYQEAFSCFVHGAQTELYTESELRTMIKRLGAGKCVTYNDKQLDPNRTFFILGIDPNASRLCVRLFLRDSLGAILRNVEAHYQRLKLQTPDNIQREILPLWLLLSETVNQNSKEKKPFPTLTGETLRAVFSDTAYPVTLFNSIMLRIRSDHKVNYVRASILKAYFLKNPHKNVPAEILTEALNIASRNVPYVLGRLFATLESIQMAATPGINNTIRATYLNLASASPAAIFPTLLKRAQNQSDRLDPALRRYYEKQIAALLTIFNESFPSHINPAEQGAFMLGYYHERQAHLTPKTYDLNPD